MRWRYRWALPIPVPFTGHLKNGLRRHRDSFGPVAEEATTAVPEALIDGVLTVFARLYSRPNFWR